jgi:hypothetical protein
MPRSRRTRRWRATRRWARYRASQTRMSTRYLMIEAAALKRRIDATPPGMARLSGGGPPGTVCEQCSFYGYGAHPNSCYQYFVQSSDHGAAFPAETPSCQRFRPRSL